MKNSLRPLGLLVAAASLTILATGCPKPKQADKVEPPPTPAPTSAPAVKVSDDSFKTKPEATPAVTENLMDEKVFGGYVKHVYFDFDKYDIREDAKATLEKNAEFLRGHANIKIRVEGHCDERGTDDYNMGLGDRRANAVKKYLVSLGVDASRIETISMGKQRPLDPGHDEAAWAKNRRGHFLPVSSK